MNRRAMTIARGLQDRQEFLRHALAAACGTSRQRRESLRGDVRSSPMSCGSQDHIIRGGIS